MALLQEHNDNKRAAKQIGCISSFLHIFDRQQILARKRIHSTKRLPYSTGVGASFDSTKTCKETHRLSLDSRTSVGNASIADDDQLRSPGVIARLMGLEPLSYSDHKVPRKPVLQRSASEPRVSTDLIHPKTSSLRSRSFFDPVDHFTQPNQTTMHKEIETKLTMRRMNQQSNDLNTLKQILEVLQLKGLLHSTNHSNVYERNLHESGIVLMKPSKSSADDSQGTRRYATTSSANRVENNVKTCNSISKMKPLSIEIQNTHNVSCCNKSPSVDSHTRKRSESVHYLTINQSTGNQKPSASSCIKSPNQKLIKLVVEEDESSSISTASTMDSERSKCDGCIMEMKSSTESSLSSMTVLPSPVSVLDSGFDMDEGSTPSRSIDIKATDFKDENRTPNLSPTNSTQREDEFTSDDTDFIYISKIVQLSQHVHEHPDIFISIEKQFYNNTKNASNVSRRQRKLVYDVVFEIIDKNKQLPPWKTFVEESRALLKHIWFEFRKIREINTSDGILEFVNGVLKKDLVESNDWDDYPIETSEAILDIERMIFKDLVTEAIRDLAEFSSECIFLRFRRKLAF